MLEFSVGPLIRSDIFFLSFHYSPASLLNPKQLGQRQHCHCERQEKSSSLMEDVQLSLSLHDSSPCDIPTTSDSLHDRPSVNNVSATDGHSCSNDIHSPLCIPSGMSPFLSSSQTQHLASSSFPCASQTTSLPSTSQKVLGKCKASSSED